MLNSSNAVRLARACQIRVPLNALLFLCGLALLYRASGIGMGTPAEPGPGLWPAVVGAGLSLSAALNGFRPVNHSQSKRLSRQGAISVRPVAGLILACVLWIGLLTPLGWLPATVLALASACKGAGTSLKEALWLAALLTGGLYFGVEKLLNWPLPEGTLFTLLFPPSALMGA